MCFAKTPPDGARGDEPDQLSPRILPGIPDVSAYEKFRPSVDSKQTRVKP